MKKKNFAQEPPEFTDVLQANVLIRELWEQLRHYQDKLTTSSRNSSKSPSADTPAAKAERKKLNALVVQISAALNQATRDTNDR